MVDDPPDLDEPPDIDFGSKKKEEKSLLDTIGELFSNTSPKWSKSDVEQLHAQEPGAFEKLPIIGEYLRKHRLESTKNIKEGQPQEIVGPGMGPEIISKGASKLADVIDPPDARENRGVVRPFIAGAVKGIGDLVQGGLDPRAVNVHKLPEVVEPVPPPKPQLQLGRGSYIAGPSGEGGIIAPPNTPLDIQAEMAGLKTNGIPSPQATPVDTDALANAKRVNELNYTQAAQHPGTSMDVQRIGPYEDTLPYQSGDTRGGFASETQGSLGYPLDVVPNRLRPRAAQTEILSNPARPNVEPVEPLTESNISFSDEVAPDVEPLLDKTRMYLGEGTARPGEPQLPSAPIRTKNQVFDLPPIDEVQKISGKPVEPPIPEGYIRLYRGEYHGNEPLTTDRQNINNRGQAWTSQRNSAESYTHPNIQDYLDTPVNERKIHPEGSISYVDVPKNSVKASFSGNDVNQENPYDHFTLSAKQARGAKTIEGTKPITSKNVEPPSSNVKVLGNIDVPPIKGQRITPKEAIQRWAWGRDAAKERGTQAADEFKDLSDPTYIDQYQTGNRQGPLAKVQTFLDDLFSQEKKAGLLKDDAYKDNYLRQYWDLDASSPESIAAFQRSRIARTPGFAKESTFDTYQAGIEAGLVPKYKSIPEIIEARVTEHARAMKNKELYDWLVDTGQMKTKEVFNKVTGTKETKPVGVIQSPDTWSLIGPHKEELQKYITNYLGHERPFKGVADVVSATKNIYLGGGVPGTKYNMHAWNIARADAKLNGYISAGKRFLSDPTGKQALNWLENMPKEERALIPELIEHGFTTKPIEDMGKELTVFSNMAEHENPIISSIGKVGDKALSGIQKVFEAPLFERALPAMKLQRTLEAYHALEPELGRSKALSAASKIGNEFYGGVNKAIRNKTRVDASRIAFLAPDWLESRLRLAASEWKGTAKTLTGRGDAVDKIYAKSFARGAGLTAVGAFTGGKFIDAVRNRSIGAVPLGDVKEGVHREFPTMTSADEGQRLPVQVPINMYEGNPAALKDILIKNRISTPASAFMDIVRGQDTFGNPLSGKDKYGKSISFGKSIENYALEASRPLQHQAVQGLIGWLNGSLTTEEAISMGAELPLNYNRDKVNKKKASGNIPELRVP